MPSSRKSFGIFFFMNLLYSSWFSLTRSARGRFLRRAAAGWGSSSASLSDDGGMPMAGPGTVFVGPLAVRAADVILVELGPRCHWFRARRWSSWSLCLQSACSPSPLLSTSLRSINVQELINISISKFTPVRRRGLDGA